LWPCSRHLKKGVADWNDWRTQKHEDDLSETSRAKAALNQIDLSQANLGWADLSQANLSGVTSAKPTSTRPS
jgi:uncharacterized protein YjbI with pentapeptide repeats